MGVIMPSNWRGWTSLAILIALFIVAAIANGTHKTLRAVAYSLIAVVALVTAYNELMSKK